MSSIVVNNGNNEQNSKQSDEGNQVHQNGKRSISPSTSIVKVPKLDESTSNSSSSSIDEIFSNSHSNKPGSNNQSSLSNGILQNNHVHNGVQIKNIADEHEYFQGGPNQSTKEIERCRLTLPIHEIKRELIDVLRKESTIILEGETGSGKTTQIPQYILEGKLLRRGKVCVSQPRRVAAMSIAKRVAQEVRTELGQLVGYAVRFENCFSNKTKIKFMTDGLILRESVLDPLLMSYDWIILDEAHERSINTDILFGVVKKAQQQRKKMPDRFLKVIVMSATMNTEHFADYFVDPLIVTVPGRQHPIKYMHAIDQDSHYLKVCAQAIFKINKVAPCSHGILVFLTGQEEIDNFIENIRSCEKDAANEQNPKLSLLPLYAALPPHEQGKIFQKVEVNTRKVIVSTNISETSITIPGIKYVVDSGRSKVRTFDPITGYESLKVMKISKAQANQRSGRAGREGPGTSYSACTLEEYEAFPNDATPEILQANLSSVILQMLVSGIEDPLTFEFLDSPPEANIKACYSKLENIGAVTIDKSKVTLTDAGRTMAKFPIEPTFSRILLSSKDYGCVSEILTIISVLSCENIYVHPRNKWEIIEKVRQKFSSDGDHVTILKIFNAFITVRKQESWCRKNFLHYRNLKYATKIRKQLEDICIKEGFEITSCKEKTEPILRSMITGLYTNIAELQRNMQYLSLHNRQPVYVFPSSIIGGAKHFYLMYTHLVNTNKTYMHYNSKVNPKWLIEYKESYFRNRHIRSLTEHLDIPN